MRLHVPAIRIGNDDLAPALPATLWGAGDIQASQNGSRRYVIQKSKSLSSGWSSGLRPMTQ
jgi:hypothetical protein